jgi:ER degradation enhancer, mannosidase alpha-like 2
MAVMLREVAMRIARPISALTLVVLLGCGASVQESGSSAPAPRKADPAAAERVRQAFLHAWHGYRQYAWGHDDLNPVSRTSRDWYGVSLLMTPVDAYDTMLLMGLRAEAADAKRLILQQLSFDQDISVQLFEVTIRLLGGLLSAYQIDGDRAFLKLATELGTRLLPAFDSPTGMPYRFVNLRTGAIRDSLSNPAEIGTLMLEFGTLSKLTGNPVYYQKAKAAVAELFRRRSSLDLVGSTIDVRTGTWQDTVSHVGSGIDSYFEYLLKSWRLFGDPDFQRMWDTSISAVQHRVADERYQGLWYGQVGMRSGVRTGTQFGSLEAFLPAVLVLAGDTVRAERLMESVYRMWTSFTLEPETMDYSTMSIVSPEYQLRPESLESAYYLYCFTGRQQYQDMGKTMFDEIERWTRTDAGFSALADVRSKHKADRMHSFLFAETFKYAYLLFAAPSLLDLRSVVFNTEAHPLKRTW